MSAFVLGQVAGGSASKCVSPWASLAPVGPSPEGRQWASLGRRVGEGSEKTQTTTAREA